MPGSVSKKVLTPGTTVHRGEPEALSLKMRKGFFASMLSFLSFSKRFEPMVARLTRFSSVVAWENQNLALLMNRNSLREGSLQYEAANWLRRTRSIACSITKEFGLL